MKNGVCVRPSPPENLDSGWTGNFWLKSVLLKLAYLFLFCLDHFNDFCHFAILVVFAGLC